MAGSEKRPGTIPASYKGIGQNPDKGGQVSVGTGRKGPPVVTATDRTPPKKAKEHDIGADQGGGKSPGRVTDKSAKAKGKVGARVVTKSDKSSASKKTRSMGKMTGGYT